MENRPVPLYAKVLIVGVGGLGSPAAMALAAAGVMRMTLVDFDDVDESNLQRQVLFSTADVGQPKLRAAERRLREINPDLSIDCVAKPFSADNGLTLVQQADIVVDGTDNFPARYLVNDACVLTGTPNVFGSVQRFEGQVSVFAAPGGPCYRCLHPEPPPQGLIPSCAEGGVLGVLPGFIGMIQAVEALKVLTGLGQPLIGRLLIYDALKMRARDIVLARDPACPACGDVPTIRTLESYEMVCASDRDADLVSVAEYDDWRTTGRAHTLVDVREPDEHAAASIDGALLIPLGELERRLELLPRDRVVVLHCRSGGRSRRAASLLRARGFDARSLDGGLSAWIRRSGKVAMS